MPAILIAIFASMIQGQSIAAVIGALTGGQWLTLAEGIIADLDPNIAKDLGVTSESLGALIKTVLGGVATDVAIPGCEQAR